MGRKRKRTNIDKDELGWVMRIVKEKKREIEKTELEKKGEKEDERKRSQE